MLLCFNLELIHIVIVPQEIFGHGCSSSHFAKFLKQKHTDRGYVRKLKESNFKLEQTSFTVMTLKPVPDAFLV